MKPAREIILIILLIICTVSSIQQTVRVNSRRAQQSRIKVMRRPLDREVRL